MYNSQTFAIWQWSLYMTFKNKKYIFADMDGTLAVSKTKVEKDLHDFLQDKNLVVISGARMEQMEYQLEGIKCEMMAQCGNQCFYWEHSLTNEMIDEISRHVNLLRNYFKEEEKEGLVYFDNRGFLVNYSVIGGNNIQEKKLSFDPDFEKRKKALEVCPFNGVLTDIKIAGTTGFDYTPKGRNKGSNVADFIKIKKWNKEECIYFGDALFKGGNDESVIGVIDTVSVDDPLDTFKKMKEIFINYRPSLDC